MITDRLVQVRSKLGFARGVSGESACTSIGEVFGLGAVADREPYLALDWLFQKLADDEGPLPLSPNFRAFSPPAEPKVRKLGLKTVNLDIRPIRHWTTKRVHAHVFLCMLAYPTWNGTCATRWRRCCSD